MYGCALCMCVCANTAGHRCTNLMLSALGLRMFVKLTFAVLSSLVWFLAMVVSERGSLLVLCET